MEMKEIQERAKKIRNLTSIDVLLEKRVIEDLIKIEESSDKSNIEYYQKTLDCIEKYLYQKKKVNILENDIQFLEAFAKNLREQDVRKTDISTPPLFKLKDNDGQELYFITRKAMNEYMQNNGIDSKSIATVIEIPSSHSMELLRLVEIIKRNF